jgi:lipopolysaccharide export system protein LptC
MNMAPARHPDGRARRDWSGRTRSSALDALRYTRFVAWMRRGLMLGASAIIFAVLAFFFVQRQPRQLAMSYEKMGHVENDLAMLKPRLTGSDDKGNPFVITADAAIQDAANAKRAKLKNIEADVAMGKNGWINARAKQGSVDMAAHRLELDGGIDLFTDRGYELHTQSASVDLADSILDGHTRVTGQGPLGTLAADGFHADREKNQLLLIGHVHMTFNEIRK